MSPPGSLARGRAAPIRARRALLVVAAAAALTAVLAGLARLGLPVAWGPRWAAEHGPLFTLAVFGSVIALERAVALAKGWALLAPALGAIAGVAMLARLPGAPVAALASSLALAAINAAIVRRQSVPFTWLMLAGSLLLVAGNVGWMLGRPLPLLVPCWIAFFVLTIVAERLELSRLAAPPRWATVALLVLSGLLAVAAFALLCGHWEVVPAFALALALVGAWQLRFDLARRTIRLPGLPRYSALAVLAGASWLVVGGILALAFGLPPAGYVYDAVLHSVFVGYVLSMVMAHAPIILPAVAMVRIPWNPALWSAPAVLHLGLVARVAGDLFALDRLRQIGGIANAVALLALVGAAFWARSRAAGGRLAGRP